MSENLARASTILLFGRVVEDIQINAARGSGASAKRAAKSASAGQQGVCCTLADRVAAEGSCLARIYAFSYEGHYYDLSKPALILVHGAGAEIGDAVTVERIGSAATGRAFASDVRVWAYDKSDISIRLDPETGTFEQILLDAETTGERVRIQYSGERVRLRGDRGSGNDTR
jgi:hypothetical protein